jgi:ribosomal protein S18 acetylase RimI-like enzyme
VVEIRLAEVSDASQIGEILVEGFINKFGPIFGRKVDRAPEIMAQMMAREIRQGDAVLFVAQVRGRVVGVLRLHDNHEALSDAWFDLRVFLREVGLVHTVRAMIGLLLLYGDPVADAGYISEVAVDAAYRRQGIGRALLSRAECWAPANDKIQLSLHVADTNRARALYERFGFRAAGVERSRLSERLFGIRSWVYMIKSLE